MKVIQIYIVKSPQKQKSEIQLGIIQEQLIIYEQTIPHLKALYIGINFSYKPNFYCKIYLSFQYDL